MKSEEMIDHLFLYCLIILILRQSIRTNQDGLSLRLHTTNLLFHNDLNCVSKEKMLRYLKTSEGHKRM